MKAVRLNELGGPEKLHVEDIPQPKPGPGEILVRIKRAAFNRRDVFITQNLYPGIVLPRTLGSDGTGTIAELGEGVSGFEIGASVVINPEMGWAGGGPLPEVSAAILGMPKAGTFPEYVVVPAANVFPKPAALSDDEAAAIPLAGLTAYRATFTRGKITKDDVVFIPGPGSGGPTSRSTTRPMPIGTRPCAKKRAAAARRSPSSPPAAIRSRKRSTSCVR